MRFLSIVVLVFSLSSCSSINLTEPQPEPKRQSILGAPLTYSTETGKFFSRSSFFISISVRKLEPPAATIAFIPGVPNFRRDSIISS